MNDALKYQAGHRSKALQYMPSIKVKKTTVSATVLFYSLALSPFGIRLTVLINIVPHYSYLLRVEQLGMPLQRR
jgi:hypothetical protein